MKTKILMSLILIASIAMFSSGAFAYFSTARTAGGGMISAGTMGIQLAVSASKNIVPAAFSDTVTPPWYLDKMVPGKETSGCLWVKNTGNVDAVGVRWDFKNLVNSTGVKLEDRMEMTALSTSDSLYSWPAALLPGGAYYAGGAYDQNTDGKISLGEMARWSERFAPNNYDWVNDNEAASFLLTVPPGDTGYICMALKMMNGTPAEDNPFQGAMVTYDVVVTANNPGISATTP